MSAISATSKRKVLFVLIDVTERVAPLLAGYLQGFACTDAAIEGAWTFAVHVDSATTTDEELLGALLDSDADLYAFSCYVWNMGLFRRVLPRLLEHKPDAHVILGGPQVMNCAERYLAPEHDRLVLCNGEGELTFRDYLSELTRPECDYERVGGLSFYRDGELITTAANPRLKDVDSIPSPYLNGLIETGAYTVAHLETNRGCPFRCQYCYWGGAVGAKVNRFDEQRIRDEITWLARNGIFFIFIVDANFGMLERDVAFAEHIALCKREYGFPMEVVFCSSKNTPDRVSRITHIFHEAGLLTSQSIAIQTLSPTVLEKVSRENIQTSAYERLQQDLNDNDISSFIEIIWPLPGETLESFRDGVNRLCECGSDSIVFYPLLLMNNVQLNENEDTYGLVTTEARDPNSEADLVIQTREVSLGNCVEGWRFAFAAVVLYDARSLYVTAHYLNETEQRSYADLFSDFVTFLGRRPQAPLSRLCEETVEVSQIEFTTFGRVLHYVSHAWREDVDALLAEFVSEQLWWNDPIAQAYFEVDLINRPYVYGTAQYAPKQYPFSYLDIVHSSADGYVVDLLPELQEPLRRVLGTKAQFNGGPVLVRHRRNQLAYMTKESDQHNFLYCTHKLHTLGEIQALWQEAEIISSVPSRNGP